MFCAFFGEAVRQLAPHHQADDPFHRHTVGGFGRYVSAVTHNGDLVGDRRHA